MQQQLADATPIACAQAAHAKLAYASVLMESPSPLIANARQVIDEAAALVAATVVMLKEDPDDN